MNLSTAQLSALKLFPHSPSLYWICGVGYLDAPFIVAKDEPAVFL